MAARPSATRGQTVDELKRELQAAPIERDTSRTVPPNLLARADEVIE